MAHRTARVRGQTTGTSSLRYSLPSAVPLSETVMHAPLHTAFILAAGLGSRLRPLTNHRPKPLLPVCGVPMLDQALALARQHGHEHVLVNAHHLWEQVAAWCETRGASLQVELPEILGTGGGLKAARERLSDRFVILNADILTDIDLSALVGAVPLGGAAMALGTDAEVAGRAPVLADASGVLVKLRELVPEQPGGVAGTHFTGVHALDRSVLDLVPEGFACIVRSAYLDLVPARRVQTTRHDGLWVDIGTPAEYLRANLDVLQGRVSPPVDPWTRGTLGPGGCWVGPGCRIEGDAAVSVLGDGAVVPAGATLRRCVVWDGVTVPEGDHEDCIIYEGGSVLSVR